VMCQMSHVLFMFYIGKCHAEISGVWVSTFEIISIWLQHYFNIDSARRHDFDIILTYLLQCVSTISTKKRSIMGHFRFLGLQLHGWIHSSHFNVLPVVCLMCIYVFWYIYIYVCVGDCIKTIIKMLVPKSRICYHDPIARPQTAT